MASSRVSGGVGAAQQPLDSPQVSSCLFSLVAVPHLASFHPLLHVHEDRVFLCVFLYVIDNHVNIVLTEEQDHLAQSSSNCMSTRVTQRIDHSGPHSGGLECGLSLCPS